MAFKEPIFVGELVSLTGVVTHAFNHTLEVTVQAMAEQRWDAL